MKNLIFIFILILAGCNKKEVNPAPGLQFEKIDTGQLVIWNNNDFAFPLKDAKLVVVLVDGAGVEFEREVYTFPDNLAEDGRIYFTSNVIQRKGEYAIRSSLGILVRSR